MTFLSETKHPPDIQAFSFYEGCKASVDMLLPFLLSSAGGRACISQVIFLRDLF